MTSSDYVLISPAKNEEDYIQKTLASVVAQTVLPRRWVIVSDGSTDGTDRLVSQYARRYDFIRLLRRESGAHSFASKVHAFRSGYDELHDIPFGFIGNLDADIELPTNYYESLLTRFAVDSQLGLAGGARMDLHKDVFVKVRFNELNFGGGYQFFRRACYEDIGGYLPLETGGEDTVAGIMARYRGWGVRAFPDLVVHHYRPTGTAQGNVIRKGLQAGKKSFLIGYHPLFACAKLMRGGDPSGLLQNLCELAGYTAAAFRGHQRQVPTAVVDFLQAEQLGRLKKLVFWSRGTASRSQLPSSPNGSQNFPEA